MPFTKDAVRTAREIIQTALAPLADSHNLACHVGNASYLDNTITFKLEVFDTASGTEPGQDDFNRYCYRYGLKEEDFGKVFTWRGRLMTLCGLKPRSRTYPLLARDNDNGKVFKLPSEVANLVRPGAMRTAVAAARRDLGDWEPD